MSCEACEKEQKQEPMWVAYYRWGTANVAVIGCKKHVAEMFEALNKVQQERRLNAHPTER